MRKSNEYYGLVYACHAFLTDPRTSEDDDEAFVKVLEDALKYYREGSASTTDLIEEWIVKNVNASVVPGDEGSDEGIVYNMIHLLRDGDNYYPYSYEKAQVLEVYNLYRKYGVNEEWLDEWFAEHKTKDDET